ncbi:MAG: 2-hydroxyacid dehydrogenase [Alphaproteobacteria bacterium]|nr:2-hydroxyacid dehydrogenase [Alphaproteobacteria bacterium]MDP6812549.1 2-hydroxyacid dehydrogenase [Alphaproteobacteria bacterium]
MSKLNAIFHYSASPGIAERLRAAENDWLGIDACAEADDSRLFELLAEAEVLWHVLKPATAEVIAAAPKLRLIQKIGVGVNTIDLDAAKARGIVVCNMPGTNSQAVAEATLLLMLAALRRAAQFHDATRQGAGWEMEAGIFDRVGELAGRTVGLVGYGAVASRLAPVLRALGARVLYTATAAKAEVADEWRELDDLLAESDVISLHLPQTDETTGLLDAAAFARMKPGAVLVNTARGGLVDEAALHDALRDGPLLAAGLDVYTEEPVAPDNPLLALENVVLMPHVAWLTPETFQRSIAVAVANSRCLLDGGEFQHRVI